MSLKRPRSRGISDDSEYGSSDAEVSSKVESPMENASDSESSDSDSSSDSSSNDSSSSSGSDSTTTTTSSHDDLNSSNASADIPSQGVVAALPRHNKLLATKCRASKESKRSFVDQNRGSTSVEADPSHESMYVPPCSKEGDTEEKKKEKEEEVEVEEEEEEIPPRGYYLSSKQVSQQSRPRMSRLCLETGAADSSTDIALNARTNSVLGTQSIAMGEESVSHIPLPSTGDEGSPLDHPADEVHPRNLVRIVMKKSGVTRGIGLSAKKLTKNPVINIFGEIVFDGCTFERELTPSELGHRELGQRELDQREIGHRELEQREPGQGELGQREPGQGELGQREFGQRELGQRELGQREFGQRELGQRELQLNSEEIKNKVCDDILQQEIRREIGEGRERSRTKEKEEQEEVDRQDIFGGDNVKDEVGRSLQTVGMVKESRNNHVRDIPYTLKVASAEKLFQRFPTKLVDYDDDDGGSCQGRSKSEDENTSDASALRVALRKDLHPSEGTRDGQRERKHRPEQSRSYSRKRRHSPSTSSPSTDERDSVDGSELPLSRSDEKHCREMIRNSDDRPSYTTGRKTSEHSVKKTSDLRCSDLQRHSTETRARKWGEFDRSESKTPRMKLERSTATTLKIIGTKESISAEVERDRKVKGEASASRSKSFAYENKETEEKYQSDDEELGRRESRRSRDSPQSKVSSRRISSSQLSRSSARTPSPNYNRFGSRHRQGSRHKSPTRAVTTVRNSKSRRSEACYEETGARRRESRRSGSIEEGGVGRRESKRSGFIEDGGVRRRESKRSGSIEDGGARRRESRRSRSIEVGGVRRRESRRSRSIEEGSDDVVSAQQERFEKTRRPSRNSSDRHETEKIFDETRNVAGPRSPRTSSRSIMSRSEQSGKARSRSSTVCDDASNRQSIRRHSSASTSLKLCPEEACLQVEHGRREKTRQTETLSPSELHHRCDEIGTTRQSVSGRGSHSEGVKRTGEGQARPRSSRDGTSDVSEHCSPSDGYYHQPPNHYPNDWTWSTRPPGRLKEAPNHYPFPYLHPFAPPFPSPMLRYNPYVYANYCNEDPRRFFLAQQPPSFYPPYHHRPHFPYWAPPLPQHLHPPYAPYEATVDQGDGEQYDGDGGGYHHNDLPSQDGLQERANETDGDFRSSALKVDQEKSLEDVTESVAIHWSATSSSIRGEALGTAAATRETTAEEASFSPSSPV